MSTPRRLLDGATNGEAERLMSLAASVAPKPLEPGGWEAITARALVRRPSPWRLVPAFLGSALVGATLVLLLMPRPTPPPPFAIDAVAGARWSSTSPDELTLGPGRFTIARRSNRPLTVRTPQVSLELTNARFLAEVSENGATVVVEEGALVLRDGDSERRLEPGTTWRWAPTPEIPRALAPSAAGDRGPCHGQTAAATRTCLEQEAAGTSLAAEAASYELGMLALEHGDVPAALTAWRRSLERFPNGVLAPEVRLALFVELVKARRHTEARTVAKAFLAAFPDDPRTKDVAAIAQAIASP